MRAGQAKALGEVDIRRLLKVATNSRHPDRNRVIVLLSVRAGLRASEIACLNWSMITDGRGHVGRLIELPARVVKYGLARRVPLHPELRAGLLKLKQVTAGRNDSPVVASERRGDCDNACGQPMKAKAIVNWFTAACRDAGLEGCASHSGRRTFVTRAARA